MNIQDLHKVAEKLVLEGKGDYEVKIDITKTTIDPSDEYILLTNGVHVDDNKKIVYLT